MKNAWEEFRKWVKGDVPKPEDAIPEDIEAWMKERFKKVKMVEEAWFDEHGVQSD